MAFRHLLQRISPSFDRRWLIAIIVVAVLVGLASFIRLGGSVPPLQLFVLGPDGTFQDTVALPAGWADTVTSTPDGVARFPLILAVRNPGTRPLDPQRLELSLPFRYRMTGPRGDEPPSRMDPASPLITYVLDPGLGTVEPQRLPELLPGLDTVWLEVVIPSYYCVAVADSIPEFVVAPPPPLSSLAQLRIFYSFSGGDLPDRHTGTLAVRLDTTVLEKDMPEQAPAFPMEADRQRAMPEFQALSYVGSRRARCGEADDPMELLSTVWEDPSGARFIALDYGGAVRKHLYDLDGDGVIDRESWDPDRDGVFEATRRARLPIPEFLLPQARSTLYDMARLDTLPPDSLARLDPFRRAMPGPSRLPEPGDTAPPAPVADEPPPRPAPRGPQPLGRPLPPDTGGAALR